MDANPDAVAKEQRVIIHGSGPDVRVDRFGNEGTGVRTMKDFPWKLGETVRFFVRASRGDVGTVYAAYIQRAGAKTWSPMATLETRTGGALLQRLYSFIEDFRRDGRSREEARRASYGNGWVKSRDGAWRPLLEVKFTRDNTPSQAISGGVTPAGRFYLATGGDTGPFVEPKSRFKIPKPVGSRPAAP